MNQEICKNCRHWKQFESEALKDCVGMCLTWKESVMAYEGCQWFERRALSGQWRNSSNIVYPVMDTSLLK